MTGRPRGSAAFGLLGGRRQWLALVLLAMAADLQLFIFGAVASELRSELDLTYSTVGAIAAAGVAALGTSRVAGGYAIDRIGAVKVVIVGWSLSLIGGLVRPLVATAGMFAVFHVVTIMGTALIILGLPVLARPVRASDPTGGLGGVNVGLGLGAVVGLALTPVAGYFGWRLILFGGVAVMGATGALLPALRAPRTKRSEAPESRLKRAQIGVIVAVLVAHMALTFGTFIALANWATEILTPDAPISLVLLLLPVGYIAASTVKVDIIVRQVVPITDLALACVGGAVGLSLVATGNLVATGVGLALCGAAGSWGRISRERRILRTLDVSRRGAVLGWMSSLGALGAGVPSWLWGVSRQENGSIVPGMVGVAIGLMLLGAVLGKGPIRVMLGE